MKHRHIVFILASALLASCTAPEVSSQGPNPLPNESSSSRLPSPEESTGTGDSTNPPIVDNLPALAEDPVWNVKGVLNSLRGASFRAALSASIKATGSKTCSYRSLWDYFVISDASKDGTGIRPFYHSPDDKTTRGSCNKEHVWPSSRGAGETGPGSDPQVIRPAISAENSSRGNKYFGEGGSMEFDPGSLGYLGARGECARILFYAATRYYNTCGSGGSSKGNAPLILNNNPGSDTALHSLGTLKTLLKWNREYPVNEAEIKRNTELSKMGFARNPFIEHPEYADYIWNDIGLRDAQGNVPEQTGTPHALIKSVNELKSGDQVFITADMGGLHMAMGKNFSPKTPWYIRGVEVGAPKDDILKTDAADIAFFTVNVNEDKTFTFTTGGSDLYSFIDGTHYSICYGAPASPTATPVSQKWNVTLDSKGALTAIGAETNVALEYYNSSFCGYKKPGSVPLYLFRK